MRLRKQSDGSFVLHRVTPHASGLSHAKDTETPVLTLTAEDVEQILDDYAAKLGPADPATSDTTPAKPGSGLGVTAEQ